HIGLKSNMRWRETKQYFKDAWRETKLERRTKWQSESVNLHRSSKGKLGRKERMVQRRLGWRNIVVSGLFSFSIHAILHLSVRQKLHRLARCKRTLSAKTPWLLVSAQTASTHTKRGSSRIHVWRI